MSKLTRTRIRGSRQARFANIISCVSLLVAVIALIVSTIPQIIPWNKDHISRANAGDACSQMFLAEHYFEIGDYNEAIYWYKMATIEPSKYQVYAYNNLGFLYAQGFGLSDYENDGYRRFDIALHLFLKADKAGVKQGNENAKVLLMTHGAESFPESDYDELYAQLVCEESYVVSAAYEKSKTYKGNVFWDNNKKYIYVGAFTEVMQNEVTQTAYRYYVYTYEPDFEKTEFRLIYLDNIEKITSALSNE